MANSQPVRRIFSPRIGASVVFAISALLATVLLYWTLNNCLEASIRSSVGQSEAVEYLSKDDRTQLQAIDASDVEASLRDPFELAAGFGFFDVPLGNPINAEVCAFPSPQEVSSRAPLTEYLTRLTCMDRRFGQSSQHPTQLAETLDVAEQCELRSVSVTGGEAAQAAVNGLMPGLTGVAPYKSWWLWWLRSFAEIPKLVETAGRESLPRGNTPPAIYRANVARDLGSALPLDPECEPMREFLDEMSVTVLDGYAEVTGEVFIRRWVLRALNGPIQATIVFLTFWGCFRLLARRFRERGIAPDLSPQKRPAIMSGYSSKPPAEQAVRPDGWERWLRLKQLKAARSIHRREILERYGNNVAEAETALLRVHREVDLIEEKWLLEIIPMIGFLGTVIGMIMAMDLVGDVVSAQPGAELGVAMSRVTNALSVAFFTTLMGLISAMLLSVWNAHQSASEVRTVRAFLHLLPPSNRSDGS